MSAAPPVIVLHHRKLGDFNGALGIAQVVAERLGAEVVVRRIALRAGALRRPAALLLGRLRRRPADPLARALLRAMMREGDGKGPPAAASAVVATLGAGELPSLWVGALTGAPSLHFGTVKRAPQSAFAAVFAHPGHDPAPGEIGLPLVPTRLRRAAFADPDAPERGGLLLAIGGGLKSRPYAEPFWTLLLRGAAALAAARGRGLWITTSPRTGAVAEARIAALAAEAGVPPARLALFGRGDAPPSMADLLARCGEAVVTADSTSMLSDAVASGARVVAALDGGPPAEPRPARFLESLVAARVVAPWRVADPPPDPGAAIPRARCWSADLLAALRGRVPALAATEGAA